MGNYAGGQPTKWGHLRTIHYYAQGLFDLEDIVTSVNKMIELQIPQLERQELKRLVTVSSAPLKGRSAGMIVKITLPCMAIYDEGSHVCCGQPQACVRLGGQTDLAAVQK